MGENIETLIDFDNQPIMLLEGGKGLNDLERSIYNYLVERRYEVFSLEDLYDKPERVVSIQFLKPKAIIFGTTGVYREDLGYIIEAMKITDLNSVEKVFLTLGSKDVLWRVLKEFKHKYPKIEFYDLSEGFEDGFSLHIEKLEI